MTRNDVLIRPARKEDASTLANLINIAGEGIPLWLWRQSTTTDKEALALGAERAARDSGGFSYSNAHVAELRGEVVAIHAFAAQRDEVTVLVVELVDQVVEPVVRVLAELAHEGPVIQSVHGRQVTRPGRQGRRPLQPSSDLPTS